MSSNLQNNEEIEIKMEVFNEMKFSIYNRKEI